MKRKLKIARYLFDRHGGTVVFFGWFVSVLRTYAAFLAGANRMRWPRFLAANGAITWAGACTLTRVNSPPSTGTPNKKPGPLICTDPHPGPP